MKVAILDKKVRHNIALFRHLIHRYADKKEKFFQTARKTYKGYVNCKTGELRFSDLQRGDYSSNEWKAILIRLHPNNEGAFEVFSTDEHDCFNCSKLESNAYAVFTKTLHILNQLSYDPKHGKNPFWVLKHIAVLDFVATKDDEDQCNLIHEAWHNIDRNYAEYLLSSMPVGTYLFRKDEFAQILEDNLNKSLSSPISCITLTFRGWNKKISEKVLIYQEGNWLFYNNDPSLLGPRYSSVKELLASMGNQIKKPLLADNLS